MRQLSSLLGGLMFFISNPWASSQLFLEKNTLPKGFSSDPEPEGFCKLNVDITFLPPYRSSIDSTGIGQIAYSPFPACQDMDEDTQQRLTIDKLKTLNKELTEGTACNATNASNINITNWIIQSMYFRMNCWDNDGQKDYNVYGNFVVIYTAGTLDPSTQNCVDENAQQIENNYKLICAQLRKTVTINILIIIAAIFACYGIPITIRIARKYDYCRLRSLNLFSRREEKQLLLGQPSLQNETGNANANDASTNKQLAAFSIETPSSSTASPNS